MREERTKRRRRWVSFAPKTKRRRCRSLLLLVLYKRKRENTTIKCRFGAAVVRRPSAELFEILALTDAVFCSRAEPFVSGVCGPLAGYPEFTKPVCSLCFFFSPSAAPHPPTHFSASPPRSSSNDSVNICSRPRVFWRWLNATRVLV